MTIAKELDLHIAEWGEAREPVYNGKPAGFTLVSSLEVGSEVSKREDVHADLNALWSSCRSARLFEDKEFGQWGLLLMDSESQGIEQGYFDQERVRDSEDGDLVIGRFLGDSDLVILRNDASAFDYGQILIALPIDQRSDWPVVATGLEDFLTKYRKAEGAKFWEVTEGKGVV